MIKSEFLFERISNPAFAVAARRFFPKGKQSGFLCAGCKEEKLPRQGGRLLSADGHSPARVTCGATEFLKGAEYERTGLPVDRQPRVAQRTR